MAAKLHAWDRRAAESAKAFEAFAVYREQGAGRSLVRVSQEHGKSIATVTAWSGRHEWVSRAAAYDTEVARRASARTIESDADALARQIEDARAMQAEARQRFVEAATDASDMSRAEAARVWAMAAKEEREARRLPAKVDVKHGGSMGVWFGFDPEVDEREHRNDQPDEPAE